MVFVLVLCMVRYVFFFSLTFCFLVAKLLHATGPSVRRCRKNVVGETCFSGVLAFGCVCERRKEWCKCFDTTGERHLGRGGGM